MTDTALAMVLRSPGVLEPERFALPVIGPDDGLLRVERCGICGSDLKQVADGAYTRGFPVIPGHEPIGIVEQIGDRAAERWGVQAGDRVMVETIVACGTCRMCTGNRQDGCLSRQDYGLTPTSVEPSLWGGYAEYLYLSPQSLLHKFSKDLPLDVVSTYNPFTSGLHWGVEIPDLQPGQSIAILGAGQRGLGAVIAAKEAGASDIIVTGLSSDGHKLATALAVGATAAINVEEEQLVETVHELRSGDGVDVVLDLVPSAPQSLIDAMQIVRPGGTIVVAGMKAGKAVQGLCTDDLVTNNLSIKGVLSNPSSSFDRAIKLMESGRLPLDKLHTHTFALEDVEQALLTLGGRVPGQEAICVSLAPNG